MDYNHFLHEAEIVGLKLGSKSMGNQDLSSPLQIVCMMPSATAVLPHAYHAAWLQAGC